MTGKLIKLFGIATITAAMAATVAILKKMAEPDELDRPYIDGRGRTIDPTRPFWKRHS